MSVVYAAATKNNRLKMAFLAGAVTPAAGESVDSGTAGSLVIGSAALAGQTVPNAAIFAVVTLQKPSVTISGGVATLAGLPLTASGAAVAGGTPAAKAEIRDSAGNVVISGLTVGTSATDIVLSTTTIAAGGPVTITGGTITHG